MSEQAPAPDLLSDTIDPVDLAMAAAEGASRARSARMEVEAARTALKAVDSRGYGGTTIEPEVYAELDETIQKAEDDFNLFGDIVTLVMGGPVDSAPGKRKSSNAPGKAQTAEQASEPAKVKPRPHARQEVEQSPAAAVPAAESPQQQPAAHKESQPSKPAAETVKPPASAKQGPELTQAEKNKLARDKHSQVLQHVLAKCDETGTYLSDDFRQELKDEYELSEEQCKRTLHQLKKLGCISTDKTGAKITRVTVEVDMSYQAISNGKVSPFPNDQTPHDLLEARRRELASATRTPQPEVASHVVKTSPPPAPNQTATAGSSTASSLESTPKVVSPERKKQAQERCRTILQHALTHGDANGVYHDEALIRTFTETYGMEPKQVLHAIEQLAQEEFLSASGSGRVIDTLALNCRKIDWGIAKKKLLVFEGTRSADDLLRFRRRELTRAALEEEPAAADAPMAEPIAPLVAIPPTKPASQMSARVRREMERAAAQGENAGSQVPNGATELERELLELESQASELSLEEYSRLDAKTRVALAYLDETVRDGATNLEALAKNVMAAGSGLELADARKYNKELSEDGTIEFTMRGGMIKPIITRGGRHFIRNILQQAQQAR